MATAYKDAQVQGTASTGTYSTLYSTGASTTAVVSTILICNQDTANPVTIRIGLQTSAATPGASQFLVYDRVVAAADTLVLGLGLALGNTKFIRVSSSANTCSFTAAVAEIS